MIGKTNAVTIIGSGGSTAVLREYDSSATWTKPTGLRYLIAILQAGGGGGASGSRSGTSNFYGGLPGQGGEIKELIFSADVLNDSYSIIIGAGGAGGAAYNGLNSVNVGGNGGDSLFGSIICLGGIGGNAAGYSNSFAQIDSKKAPSGGGGGYITGANRFAGLSGGANYNNDSSLNRAGGGAGGGANAGTSGSSNVITFLNSIYGIGNGGGGGGAASDITNGGDGGNGGLYGAGGGGGGAVTINFGVSGKGGDGAGGLCIIIEIY